MVCLVYSVCLVSLVCLVRLVYLVERNYPSKNRFLPPFFCQKNSLLGRNVALDFAEFLFESIQTGLDRLLL